MRPLHFIFAMFAIIVGIAATGITLDTSAQATKGTKVYIDTQVAGLTVTSVDAGCPNGGWGARIKAPGQDGGVTICSGAMGPTGPAGADGVPGIIPTVTTFEWGAVIAVLDASVSIYNGDPGADGVTGPTGPPGATGATGDTGATGPTGNPGASVVVIPWDAGCHYQGARITSSDHLDGGVVICGNAP